MVQTTRGSYALIEQTKSHDGKVIEYRFLDETPIGPSSRYYGEYLKKREELTNAAAVIKNLLTQR